MIVTISIAIEDPPGQVKSTRFTVDYPDNDMPWVLSKAIGELTDTAFWELAELAEPGEEEKS